MKLIKPTPEQADLIVRACYAVASAGGTVAPTEIEIACIDALQRHMLMLEDPISFTSEGLPDRLADLRADPQLAGQTARQLAILSTVDGVVSVNKVAVVEAAAARLGVDEFGLLVLSRIARGKYAVNQLGLMKRIVAHYWSPTGKARLKDWMAMVWTFAPWLPGLKAYLGQDEVLSKYRSLADKPEGTLGRAVHNYYSSHGFPVPGEPKAIPEGWARHEIYHLLSSYSTNLQGELLLAGFIAGNTEELALDLVLPAVVQLHAGKKFVPGPVAEGRLRPDDFFRAMARGAAMNIDLLAGWTLWEAADTDLDEVRRSYNIPPLRPDEIDALRQEKAVLAQV
jgi:hypothetical protein